MCVVLYSYDGKKSAPSGEIPSSRNECETYGANRVVVSGSQPLHRTPTVYLKLKIFPPRFIRFEPLVASILANLICLNSSSHN